MGGTEGETWPSELRGSGSACRLEDDIHQGSRVRRTPSSRSPTPRILGVMSKCDAEPWIAFTFGPSSFMNTSRVAVAYVRVSTEDQTVENQLPDLTRLAEARGLKLAKVFSENVSAVKHRPEYEAMLKLAHSGKVGTIVIWALDRLHRSMVGAMQTVLELDRLGVRVISLKEPWLDTTSPVRPLLVAVFGWVAEQERARISDRTRCGLDRARRAGKKLGRPGFDLDVVRARALRDAGKSYRTIAAELGVSVGKVHETLAGRKHVRQTSRKTSSEEAQILGAS